tara:strand:+ start:140 stop:337 length:198 start_codon:yes stop_codon:yes gene_type:complete
MADFKALYPAEMLVTLGDIKAEERKTGSSLLCYTRCSVSTAPAVHWKILDNMAGVKANENISGFF